MPKRHGSFGAKQLLGLASLTGRAQMTVDRNMRGNRSISQVVHEPRDVIGLVRPQGDPLRAPQQIDHRKCNLPFGGARRLAHSTQNRQTIAVLHQRMPHIAQLSRLPSPFL
jgi:hypothetical protein